jgi:adenosylcobinamide kinase/adenosylcobinamide-phosphate guanylyltransferase
MRRIIYITGGERSGKSTYAQKLVLAHCPDPVYLATAKILDNDFEHRISRHKQQRGTQWELVEEPVNISRFDFSGRWVLLDCVTLWLSNIFFGNDQQIDECLELSKSLWMKFIGQDFNLVTVSNEIGMGVHGTTYSSRKFVELQGWMNQFIAGHSNEAYLMISGIPLKIK